jgi:hypothetical protein
VIPVGQLAPGDQWDQTLLDELFDNRLYPTSLQFTRIAGYPNSDGVILVIPGRYWHERTADITVAISRYDWVLAVLTSDEESTLDIGAVTHPNLRWWIQSPRIGRDYGNARLIGLGFTPHCARFDAPPPHKNLDLFLAAQRTHQRRDSAFSALEQIRLSHVMVHASDGFSRGLPAPAYAAAMKTAKVAPAPAGPATPDTFRVYEALQAHAVPIADDVTPGHDSAGFWRRVFPDAPFPVLADYATMTVHVDHIVSTWPTMANRVAAWWIRQKRRYAHWLVDDLQALGALR